MANIIIPKEKMARYIKYCQDEKPQMCVCPDCNKVVNITHEFPYYYDNENNDVYFASICPECGSMLISKE